MQYCPVAAGLCRGCPLSLTLYITYMDRFSRDSKRQHWVPSLVASVLLLCFVWRMKACWLQQMLISSCWECKVADIRSSTTKNEAMGFSLKRVELFLQVSEELTITCWSSNILKSYSWVRGGWSSTCNDIDALPAFVWWRELNMLLLQIKKGPITVILVIWLDFLLDISQVMCMSIQGEDPEAISGHAGKIMSLDWLGNASVSLQKS